jgi:hypothetical protein
MLPGLPSAAMWPSGRIRMNGPVPLSPDAGVGVTISRSLRWSRSAGSLSTLAA